MLNIGVPLEAVQQRMYLEGYDPNCLDFELFRSVQSQSSEQGFEYDEGKDSDMTYLKVSNQMTFELAVLFWLIVVWLVIYMSVL